MGKPEQEFSIIASWHTTCTTQCVQDLNYSTHMHNTGMSIASFSGLLHLDPVFDRLLYAKTVQAIKNWRFRRSGNEARNESTG